MAAPTGIEWLPTHPSRFGWTRQVLDSTLIQSTPQGRK
jgi:hypothetical protein